MKNLLTIFGILFAFNLNAQTPADLATDSPVTYPKGTCYFTHVQVQGAKIAPAHIYGTSVGHYGNGVKKFRITGFDKSMGVIFQVEVPLEEIESLDLSGHLLTVESKGKIIYLWGKPETEKAGK